MLIIFGLSDLFGLSGRIGEAVGFVGGLEYFCGVVHHRCSIQTPFYPPRKHTRHNVQHSIVLFLAGAVAVSGDRHLYFHQDASAPQGFQRAGVDGRDDSAGPAPLSRQSGFLSIQPARDSLGPAPPRCPPLLAHDNLPASHRRRLFRIWPDLYRCGDQIFLFHL